MQYAVSMPMNPGARRRQGGELVTSMFGGGNNNDSPQNRPKKKSTAQPRPQILVEPRGLGPILNPNENDVLSGRGGRINAHTGNVQYRQMVLARREVYLDEKTKKLEKAHIAAQIVYMIRSMNPPGRFLKEDPDGSWWDIGDQKAIKKVGQAMREDAPNVRGDAPKGDATPTEAVSSSSARRTTPTASSASKRGGTSSSKKKSPQQARSNDFQQVPLPVHHLSGVAGNAPLDGGYNLQSNAAISAAAAVAVNEFDDDDFFPMPLSKSEVFGRNYFPPGGGSGVPNEASMLSGTSAPSAMSGVSEISGLTDPISALSGSQFLDGKQEFRAPQRVPATARDRMIRLGERVAIDDGIVLPSGFDRTAVAEDSASVDMLSLMSLGNISGVLKDADRQTTSSSKYGADDLSTVSGRMSGLSLECSTLYDI